MAIWSATFGPGQIASSPRFTGAPRNDISGLFRGRDPSLPLRPPPLAPYNALMDVREVGEFGLLERIAQWVREGTASANGDPSPKGHPLPPLCLGIGDDAAAWRSDGALELWTTDTMVEGVHFLPRQADWGDVGWKIMAANVSDIAAMGGTPTYALVTLGLPDGTQVKEVEHLYQGLLAMANLEGVRVAGGDVVRSPAFFVTVALTGVAGEALLKRSAARPGDRVAVSGSPGLSGGGLRLALQGASGATAAEALLWEAHSRPRPQVALGHRLVTAGVRTAIDTSDGLLDDLAKVCLASGVAAQVERVRIPIHPALRQTFPQDYWGLVLGGGEDYQLLFTAPPGVMERVAAQEAEGVTVIGEISSGKPGGVTVVDSDGRDVPPPRGGWDHFRP